jgi:UDP-sugar transporter A1/2/3
VLQAFHHTGPITYNLISQSKIFFTAFFLFSFLGKKQSTMQVVALGMIMCAAMIITHEPAEGHLENSLALGVLPLVSACVLSGVNAAVTQKALQGKNRNSCMYTMELGVYGTILLTGNWVRQQHQQHADLTMSAFAWDQLFEGFTFQTFIPMAMSAFGGILVGLVTKHAGAVEKSISMVAGICLTALARCLINSTPLQLRHLAALALIVVGSMLHSQHPHVEKQKATHKKIN